MLSFNSQFGEDIYIFNRFINNYRQDGKFIELGAIDGISYSITYFFEKFLGFNGILIEPTINYEKLIVNRPNCDNYNYAVNYTCENAKFIGEGCTAGLKDSFNETFIKQNNINTKYEYYVECKPMKDIIKSSQLTYIDLFIIDVEGAERIVLETIDFNIPIYIIIIELDETDKEKDNKCREILMKNGFEFNIRVNINEFWINNNYFRKELLYTPNNNKINLNNLNQYGTAYGIDLNHHAINELQSSLLL
jgi:FkbM family methyltransferase